MEESKGSKRYPELTGSDIDMIKELYNDENISQKLAQELLAQKFGITKRTVRLWAYKLELGLRKDSIMNQNKVMVYDIETSRMTVKTWWTGKQYINHGQIKEDPVIISIAWKWLGSDEVKWLHWDEKHCDKTMLEAFLKEYNEADMVIGQNNDRFDNRWINARALKHNLDVNVYVKSFDLMKQTKRLFRLPSYSMAYITKYLGVTLKQNHEGIYMWDMVEDGNEEEQKEYLKKMIDYNIGDIVSTEEMYLKMRKYMGHVIHLGSLIGLGKYSCPNCGSEDIKIYKTVTTGAGTIQRVMKCNECEVQFKVSNSLFLKNNLEIE